MRRSPSAVECAVRTAKLRFCVVPPGQSDSNSPIGGRTIKPPGHLHADCFLDSVQDAKRIANLAHVTLAVAFFVHRLAKT